MKALSATFLFVFSLIGLLSCGSQHTSAISFVPKPEVELKRFSAREAESRPHLAQISTSQTWSVASTSVDAISYKLYFYLDPENTSVQVAEKLRLRQKTSSPEIVLDAGPALGVNQVAINGQMVSTVHEGAALKIPLSQELQQSEYLDLEFQLEAVNPKAVMFFSNENDVVFQAASSTEPIDSRTYFVGVDRPDDKALFETIVKAPANWKTLSNGLLISSEVQGEHSLAHWKMPDPMPTYLFSFTSGLFQIWEDGSTFVPVAYWYPKEVEKQVLEVFGRTPKMIEYLSTQYIKYPFNKYDVGIINEYSAMEHTTATTFGQNLLEEERDFKVAEDIAFHELSHHWFGDLVTCETWNDLWVNEGFATFSEFLFQRDMVNENAYFELIRDDRKIYFKSEGENFSLGPVFNPATAPDDKFNEASYEKPGLILNMLRHQLGEDIFLKGLRRYLTENYMSNGNSKKIQVALEKESGKSLDSFFKQWIYKAGFPDLKIAAAVVDNILKIEIAQKQPGTIGLFEFPMEIGLVDSSGKMTIQELHISKQVEEFNIPLNASFETVLFDPSYTLLARREMHLGSLAGNILWKSRGTPLHQYEALDELGATLALEELKKIVSDKARVPGLRAEALKILVNRFPAEKVFLWAYLRDSHLELRMGAAENMRFLNPRPEDAEIIQGLEPLLADESVHVVQTASSSLAILRPQAYVEIFRSALSKILDRGFEKALVKALGFSSDGAVVDLLKLYLGSSSMSLRLAAIKSITDIKVHPASEILSDYFPKELARPDSYLSGFQTSLAYIQALANIHDEVAKSSLQLILKSKGLPEVLSNQITLVLNAW